MDYRKYRCNLWERLGCLAAGTAVAAAIAWLFYRSWYGMVLVIPVNYLIVSYYKNKKRDERAKKLMIEFRDAIQAVAAALLAGYSIEHAWKEAEREIMDLYGKEAMITKELIQMNAEIKLNRNVEEILHDLAVRSGVEEIQSFAEIFGFAKRSGGDFPQIIRTTAARISAKIEVEREVDTVIAGKKLVIVAIFHRNTNTVCIGIGCQNDVRILLLGQTQCVCKCLGILRVRVIQCGEVWIRILLFGNYIDVLKSQLGQDTSYRLVTGTA